MSKDNSSVAMERILASAAHAVGEAFDESVEDAIGDSPIEKALWVALQMRATFGRHEYHQIVLCPHPDELASMQSSITAMNAMHMIVEPQRVLPEIDGWRVDFLVHAFGYTPRKYGWRRLIVECDGHDFHERTKEQAAKDRNRDRIAQQRQMQIFRFTGSEIYRDAWACAGTILEWAAEGV
jgi:very-short-patch-repair endonuclease